MDRFCFGSDYGNGSLALAATGSTDGKISIWDVQTHRLRQTLSHEVILKECFATS